MTRANIKVLELRNYLLYPNSLAKFADLSNDRFVEPMARLGGYTLGQFTTGGADDRFVWMRGYHDMTARIDFLNAFYLQSEVWKAHRNDANALIVNSDNVYLLRPLNAGEDPHDADPGIDGAELDLSSGVTVVDLYICNSHRDETIDLFRKEYFPFLEYSGVRRGTMWISEVAPNDFPQLPAFQDPNLLVTFTNYANPGEYRAAIGQLESVPASLRTTMLELITIQTQLVLYPIAGAPDSKPARRYPMTASVHF